MGGVDHHHIHPGINQCLAAFKPGIADSGGGGHPQTPHLVLAGLRVQDRFFGVLQRQKPGQFARAIGDQQLFNPPRLHQADRGVPVHRFAQKREVVSRHHHRNRRLVIRGKAHVAVGDDAHHTALAVNDRKASDLIALHQHLGIGQGLIGGQSDRRIDDAGFKPLHPPHLARLRLKVKIAVDDPDPAGLRHGNRHAPFGHSIHCAGQQRDVHADGFGDEGGCLSIRGQHAGCRRHQEHVIKGKCLANLQGGLHALGWGVFV